MPVPSERDSTSMPLRLLQWASEHSWMEILSLLAGWWVVNYVGNHLYRIGRMLNMILYVCAEDDYAKALRRGEIKGIYKKEQSWKFQSLLCETALWNAPANVDGKFESKQHEFKACNGLNVRIIIRIY